jgi:hypothetical protein
MTRKHYQQIAEIIRQTYLLNDGHHGGTIAHIAEEFAKVAKKDNPNFSVDKFLEACGMDDWEWAI